MVTPTVTFRVKPERQKALRRVVNAVKDDPRLLAAVGDLVRHGTAPGTAAAGSEGNLGPFRSEAAALSFLVGRLKTALNPEAIFLFGSRAAGTARPDSDFDLLVILPGDESGPPDYLAAYAPIAGCGLGVDVVPCRLADFESDRQRPGTIAYAADRTGRLLYARPGSPLRAHYRSRTRPEPR